MELFTYRTLFTFTQRDVTRWHFAKSSLKRSFPKAQYVDMTYEEKHSGQSIWRFAIKNLFKQICVMECQYDLESSMLKLNQLKGPFRQFSLTIHIRRESENSCELIEEVRFTFKVPWLFPAWRKKRLQKKLKSWLTYKHEVLNNDLSLLSKYTSVKGLKVLIIGASGLIGSELASFLECAHHRVSRVVRKKQKTQEGEIYWNPEEECADKTPFEGFDVAINLAGVNIAKKRWSDPVKKNIFASRIMTTEKLVQLFAQLKTPPEVFLSASAVGYYGEQGEKVVDESIETQVGDFLSETCHQWERAAEKLKFKGSRVVNPRFGVVLSAQKGALKRLIFPFRLGLGAILGSGKQYMSWIAIDDAVAALYHCIMTQALEGAVNVTSSHPVKHEVFSQTLAKVLNKSLGPRLSPFVVDLFLGEMGKVLFLTSIRAVPKKLLESGFVFRYSDLKQAFRHLL